MLLTITERGGEPRTMRSDRAELNLGRALGNDVLLSVSTVDLHHARLLERDGRIIIVDLRSTSGTRINGRRIAQATIVRAHDVVTIGPFEIRVSADQATDAEATVPTPRAYVPMDPDDDEAPTQPNPDTRKAPSPRASDHTSDPTERSFLLALEERPSDDESRIVYSDWLEEHGRGAEAELIRVQLRMKGMSVDDPLFRQLGSMLRELATLADPAWRRTVARPFIEKCELRYELVCPRSWDALAVVESAPEVRFCNTCEKRVYYAESIDAARALASDGACVAVDPALMREPNDLDRPESSPPILMGMIAPPSPPDFERPDR